MGLREPLDFAFQLQEEDSRAEGESSGVCVASKPPPPQALADPLSMREGERRGQKTRAKKNLGGNSGRVRSLQPWAVDQTAGTSKPGSCQPS